MVKLDSFDTLTQKHDEILTKGYCFNSAGTLKVSATGENYSFTSKVAEKRDEGMLGMAWASFKWNAFTIKHKRNTDRYAQYIVKADLNKLLQGLEANADCKIWKNLDSTVDPSISLTYAYKDQANASIKLETGSGRVTTSFTAGQKNLGLGFEGRFNYIEKSAEKATFATWLLKPRTRLIVKYSFGVVNNGICSVDFYQKLTDRAKISAHLVKNIKSSVNELEIGGAYLLDEFSEIKGKIQSGGNMAMSLSRRLSENLMATLATQINSESLVSHSDSKYRLGVRLDFNR
ncbi:hypothetical protein SteCoe_37434 [Stentor coeruleus]|uniref:Voltage-dependent anion-selective channel protein 3 n=1 Tax=Stentor coeruleus TaxID=5963 RepID=A0A1R2AN00_9CILI|nr:hypothetical protein SteCoe_37434 [Stentor coeruleus]